jgi:hypothetical protein
VSTLSTEQFTVQFKAGENIPNKTTKTSPTSDDIINDEISKTLALTGPLTESMEHLGIYINPSVVVFRDQLLLATGRRGEHQSKHFCLTPPHRSGPSLFLLIQLLTDSFMTAHTAPSRIADVITSYFQWD